MKKIVSLLLAGALALSLAACGGENNTTNAESDTPSTDTAAATIITNEGNC